MKPIEDNKVSFTIEFRGLWLDLEVIRKPDKVDQWGSFTILWVNEVRHADENITFLLSATALEEMELQLEQMIDKSKGRDVSSVVNKQHSLLGGNPLESFPSIFGDKA
jgi:hypothetical protein